MTLPLPARQVPAIYHQRVGEMIVTAVGDGGMPVNPAILLTITPDEAWAMMCDAGRTAPMMTAYNTYLVQTAERCVLIDTGAGGLMGPTAGKMLQNLAAIGVAPPDIDTVLLTHMHIDHVGGLLDAAGAPVFPNADLLIPEAEAAFWLDRARAAAAPDAAKPSFALAQKVVEPYGNRVRRFTDSPLPGITAVPLPGHTPGHTGYLLESGEGRLLIWGDIFHAPEIQSRRPEIAVTFDADPAMAIASRRHALAMAATERLLVAGMHMNFPGFAHVARDGEGYAIQPIAWMSAL